jgi:hypothetical protein
LREPSAAGGCYGECNSKIRNERMSVVKKNIFWLDVAMDNTMAMRVAQRASNFVGNAKSIIDGKLPLAIESRAQRFAFDERHYIEKLVVCLARIEQRENVRML